AAWLQERSGQGGRVALVAGERPERLPLSLAQNRMWFLSQFDPESAAAYNIPAALRLSGNLDVDALRAAVGDLVARHEVLRTIYPSAADGVIQVILPAERVELDLGPVDIAESDLHAQVGELVTSGFDVTTEVPVRARLLRISGTESEFVLVVVVHHIAADGSSMGPLVRDVMLAFAARTGGQAPSWAPLPVQYADYSLWQREILGSEEDPTSVISEQLGYWTQQLAGLPDQLELPWDRPRPAVQSFEGGVVAFEIDAGLHVRLTEIARQRNSTLFMVVHAAFAVLLARSSATDDIAVGTPVAGRGDAALDELIGMFVNTLVFRTSVDGAQPFDQLLAQVRESDLAAFGNADVPFERLVEVLNPTRSTSRSPLVQVGFLFQNMEMRELELGEITATPVDFDAIAAKYDLQLTVADRYDEAGSPIGLTASMVYAKSLFDASTVDQLARRFTRILESIAVNPEIVVGEIELLDSAERGVLIEQWNATDHELPSGQLLLDGYRRQAALHPEAVAVVFEGQSLTYGEFSSRVNRLARHLIAEGVGPESLVALAIRRSFVLVVGFYAVLEAGGAYAPVDPDQP
ncbi:condensation domain-containing protein, partial [Rhodococcus sp. NPDC058514]|uniref:condensation domain-containing protein n=1 Tax=Rhodococcus sp. NPDC058514 TaxID=3346532 RepID=UPI00365DDF9A